MVGTQASDALLRKHLLPEKAYGPPALGFCISSNSGTVLVGDHQLIFMKKFNVKNVWRKGTHTDLAALRWNLKLVFISPTYIGRKQ